jgi:hypothetical protein
MYPCSTCDRHLRDSDRLCPFCGTVQYAVVSPCFGALALTVALLGSTACAKDPGSEGSTAGTTTTMTTTASESGESSTESGSNSTGDGDGDGDTTTNTSITSGSFYAGPVPDGWGPYVCDPFAQDCPEGEKCVAYASTGETLDSNKCVPITGMGEPGDACNYGGLTEATDDCGADSFCWADGDVGVCKAFCTGTADAPVCPQGFQCLIDAEGSINVCTSECNPLLQQCEPGFACYWDNLEFNCAATSDDIALGEPCVDLDDCALGLICLLGELSPSCAGDSCCASYCDLSAPICGQMDTQCVPFFESDPPSGLEDVGVCIVPP